MQTEVKDQATNKKSWQKPVLLTFGTVDELTGQIVKRLGFEDNLVIIVNSDITLGS